MEGFVSVLFCIDCHIQTDRNGECLACGKTITPYRFREGGKMRLIFSDGEHAKYITDIRCQRCGCTQISDTFDPEGTCWKCAVHNILKNRVMGQWRFLQYQVTLAPPTMPVKNVIKEMGLEMAKKLIRKMGGYFWEEEDESRYQTSSMSAILEKIRDEGMVTSNSMKAHLRQRGEAVEIGMVKCLFCGVHKLRIDKYCHACGTENEMVIRRDETGQMVVINVSREVSSGKELTKEMKLLTCPWCNHLPIKNADLSCSLCGLFLDAAQTQHATIEQVDGVTHERYGHIVSLHPHEGKRPDNAIRLVGVSVPPKSSKTVSSVSAPTHNLSDQSTQPNIHKDIPNPATRVEYPLVPMKSEKPSKLASVFGRSTSKKRSEKPPSDRTLRRHTKAARDAAYRREQHAARRLKAAGHSNRKIAELLSHKFGKKLSRTKVKGYFSDA